MEVKLSKTVKTIVTVAIVGVLVSMLAFVLAISNVVGQNANIKSEEANSEAIIFASPVLNAEVIKGYSKTELQFSNTMQQWEAHKAIDFGTTTPENVYCVFDGTVESITNPYLMGTTIVINHGNNLKTVYSSLTMEDVEINEGDTVKKGTVIGKTSTSAQSEAKDGNHLHFEVQLNGDKVDPNNYLLTENK